MKKTSLANAKSAWDKAVDDQLATAGGNRLKAISLAAKKHPELRAAVVKAANPKKVQDEELEQDLDSDDTEVDDEEVDELVDDDEEVEQPATKRKAKSKKRSKSEDQEELKALQTLWQEKVRSEMKRSKCDAARASAIVARKYPNVRQRLVSAANVR